ncbi:MAG: signal peptidase I [Bacilli bacterium]|nr:signal peptidase I [Bacilli bacterium]MDD4795053.1 signal peptidase I [Bacilli bacterium]
MSKNKDKELNNEEIKQKKAARDVFLDYLPYIIIVLVVVILRTFIATPVRVNGTSMDPTLHNGETMILNKLGMKTKGINRWNIVVIDTDNSHLIKRVVALPGETIYYNNNKLYINGKVLEDKYSLTETEDFEVVKLKKDEYFVMGDNRIISKDSRSIGPVNQKDIKGKTNLLLFPIDRFGIIK